jgi:transmembrane sensor
MDRSRTRHSSNKQIIDEAAEWFVEFSTGEPDTHVRRAFDKWLRKSPEHVRAYLEMFPIWEAAPLIDASRNFSADELITLSRLGGSTVVPLQPSESSIPSHPAVEATRGRRSAAATWAIAATVLLSLSGAFFWLQFQRGIYTTDTGEQRTIALPDGSIIELNARSRIRLKFRDSERRVELLAGQALFSVAKDKHRPFIVASGDTQVRAVGTQFDVYKRRTGVTVTVVEGRVAVISAAARSPVRSAETKIEHPAPLPAQDGSEVVPRKHPPANGVLAGKPGEVLLAAGEQLTVTPTIIEKPAHADVAAATAWRQRRLVFSSTPLTEVANEFNRYNDRQLIILSPALDAFNVSGVFSSTDIPSLIRFLRAQPGITVEESDAEIRIADHSR